MFEKIQQNIKSRKQRGRLKLKRRVNITFPKKYNNTIAICANKNLTLNYEQFKRIKLDLTRALSGEYKIIFVVYPNKPITNKGILVRMCKGKGKIKTYGTRVTVGSVCILLNPTTYNNTSTLGNDNNFLSSFLRKYPFFSIKK